MKFSYHSGQRPLDGYTLKRGIGLGGFGEVYFALSDGGKEVAMKVVRSNVDIELRGMKQCLNFKHPNLVHLFDIREDAAGNHWVIMEYVAGESLSTILGRHADGLAPELARQWFLGICAAVAHLHDHGVVHRDLKPGNVFIENGVVKVGDYGLCKVISGSQRSAQTQSVGTVHYMAPETSSGQYDKQIDVYAAGIMLYEMLTGKVPFEGDSVGEILIKHLTTPPDLRRIPNEFVPILSRALAKNPAHRFQTMTELARAVESVCLDPQPAPTKPLGYVAKPVPVKEEPIPTVKEVVPPWRTRLSELCTSLLLSAGLTLLLSVLWLALAYSMQWQPDVFGPEGFTALGRCLFLALACCWAVLIPARLWTRRASESLQRRVLLMCLGLAVGFLAIWLEGYDLSGLMLNHANAQEAAPAAARSEGARFLDSLAHPGKELPVLACYLSYFGLAFFGLRWWQMADRRRPQRFSFYSVMAAGLLGFFLLVLWPQPQQPLGVISLLMAAAVIQLVSPWQKPASPRPRKLRLHTN